MRKCCLLKKNKGKLQQGDGVTVTGKFQERITFQSLRTAILVKSISLVITESSVKNKQVSKDSLCVLEILCGFCSLLNSQTGDYPYGILCLPVKTKLY